MSDDINRKPDFQVMTNFVIKLSSQIIELQRRIAILEEQSK